MLIPSNPPGFKPVPIIKRLNPLRDHIRFSASVNRRSGYTRSPLDRIGGRETASNLTWNRVAGSFDEHRLPIGQARRPAE